MDGHLHSWTMVHTGFIWRGRCGSPEITVNSRDVVSTQGAEEPYFLESGVNPRAFGSWVYDIVEMLKLELNKGENYED